MASLSAIPLQSLAAAAGVGSHLAYFIHGEHLTDIPKILAVVVFLQCCVLVVLKVVYSFSMLLALSTVSSFPMWYLIGVWTSMVIYRIFFHPLRDWPGPLAARISQFHRVFQVRRLDQYRYLQELHEKYGDLVRIGPNEVSVIDPQVVELVHGSKSKCQKAAMYDISQPLTTLQQMRDRRTHDRRRRGGWDLAFSTKSMKSYEGRVIRYTDELESQLLAVNGRPVNASDWFNWFSFDVMGDLTFGQSFEGLKKQRTHWAITSIHESNAALGLLGTIPWLIHLMTKLPNFMNPMYRLLKFSEDSVEQRRKMDVKEADIMTHILAADRFFDDPYKEYQLLMGDARLLIIGGSDTTASALAFLFYHLAEDPSLVEKLRAELEANSIRNDESFTVQSVQNLPYLNALIDETLRLHPPVPGLPIRDIPPEGLKIGDTFIPGGVQILTPAYSIHRSPEAFTNPLEFIPERFTTSPELVLNKSAFFPFLIGTFACIGKQLAYREMRVVTAKLALGFDIKFAEGETGKRLFKETKDNFTLTLGPLNLCFVPRQ